MSQKVTAKLWKNVWQQRIRKDTPNINHKRMMTYRATLSKDPILSKWSNRTKIHNICEIISSHKFNLSLVQFKKRPIFSKELRKDRSKRLNNGEQLTSKAHQRRPVKKKEEN
jgi:hypothetical protein